MEKNWIEKDEDIINEFDEHLKETGLLYLNEGNYDFLHGGLGIGLYWLDKKNGVEIISKFIDILYETRINCPLGIYWINTRVKSEKDVVKEINFSLSHGMSSILVFLAKAYERGINLNNS